MDKIRPDDIFETEIVPALSPDGSQRELLETLLASQDLKFLADNSNPEFITEFPKMVIVDRNGEEKEVFKLILGAMGLGLTNGIFCAEGANAGAIVTLTPVQYDMLSAAEVAVLIEKIRPHIPQQKIFILDWDNPDHMKPSPENELNRAVFALEMKTARDLSPDGVIFVNIMAGLAGAKDMIETALLNGADGLTIGAGILTDLPAFIAELESKHDKSYEHITINLIFSDARSAGVVLKRYARQYDGWRPDMITVESKLLAGGHVGIAPKGKYSPSPDEEVLYDPKSCYQLVLPKIFETLEELGYSDMPVNIAGGIANKQDALRAFNWSHNGKAINAVQVASPFLVTDRMGVSVGEFDSNGSVSDQVAERVAKFNSLHLRNIPTAHIASTVKGMMGNALANKFTSKTAGLDRYDENTANLLRLKTLIGEQNAEAAAEFDAIRNRVGDCVDCLSEKACFFLATQWCVMKALRAARDGKDTLLFRGGNPASTQHGLTTATDVISYFVS